MILIKLYPDSYHYSLNRKEKHKNVLQVGTILLQKIFDKLKCPVT